MRYNLRVVEAPAAARILSRHLGIEVRLRVVVGRFGREPSSISGNYALGMAKKVLL